MVDVFRDDVDHPADLGVELAAFPSLLAGDLPQIFLKQFRDIEQGDKCCYQAITEAVMRVTSLNSVGLSMGHPVTFADLESTPVITELGLQGTDHTGLGFKLTVDMELQPGQVLCQFQGS